MALFGRYEVACEIGRGAMGVVYVAHDPRLGRRVALKTLALPDGLSEAQHTEFRQRFRREAHAAASLSHPGIVTVHDADEDPATGVPFIVMEYVEGRSLRDVLERDGSLAPEYAVSLATDVAAGLQSAHDAGIVHRDLKPANLLIRESDGAVKIADFGVARVPTSELTQSGMSLGTPSYMSPEQIEGRPVDGRSDLFSLAVILYEVLSGARPFAGETVPAVLHAVIHETPAPITERVAGLPVGLDRFFDRALAKQPDGRFPSARSFRDALAEAWRERHAADVREHVVAPPPPVDRTTVLENPPIRRTWRRRAVVPALVALLVLSGWVLLWAQRSAHLQLDGRSSVPAGELALLIDGDRVYSRSLSAPDRKGWIKKILDQNQETFEAWIRVQPGKRELTAEVFQAGAEHPYKDTIVVDIKPGETRMLKLVASRSGKPVSLKLD